MRIALLIIGAGLMGCATGLSVGDRAFAEGRWDEAASAWNECSGHDDEVALRLALLYATDSSALFDLPRARTLLQSIASLWPSTPSGRVAQGWLLSMERQASLEKRAAELEEGLTLAEATLKTVRERARWDREDASFALEAADETMRLLRSELELLRTELETLRELRVENETLREELEALKLIDLRR